LLGQRYAEKVIGKFYTASSALISAQAETLNFTLSGRNLSLYGLPRHTVLSVVDIFGRNLFVTKADSGNINYTFPHGGIYFLILENRNGTTGKKILVTPL
jgi:hypothetical protein